MPGYDIELKIREFVDFLFSVWCIVNISAKYQGLLLSKSDSYDVLNFPVAVHGLSYLLKPGEQSYACHRGYYPWVRSKGSK